MKYLLLSIAALVCASSYSQIVTQEGLIVDQSGDTLRGSITIKRSEQNPEWLDFEQGGTKKRYRANEVSYFRFGNDAAYVGLITDVDKSPSRRSEFEDATAQKRGVVKDTVFLSIIIQSKLSLYKLIDENSKTHYYISDNGTFQELILRMKEVFREGNYVIITTEIYKNQLGNIIKNCPSAESWIVKTEFNQKSLSFVIQEFNKCLLGTVGATQKLAGARVLFGVIGGIQSATLVNKSPVPRLGPATREYTSQVLPTVGISIEIVASRIQRKLSLANEIVAYRVNFSSESPGGAKPYFFDLRYLRYNASARVYLGEKIKTFVQGGFGAGMAYSMSHYSGNGSQFKPSKGDFGFHFSAGAKYKRVGLQARAEHSFGFSRIISFTPTINSISALLTFELNKLKE